MGKLPIYFLLKEKMLGDLSLCFPQTGLLARIKPAIVESYFEESSFEHPRDLFEIL